MKETGLKQAVKMYCTKCGYMKTITTWVEAATITSTSYNLARERRELECPRCGAPVLSEPCILYPYGWRMMKKITCVK